MLCDSVSLQLAAAADGEVELAPDVGRHVDECLRCQAELVQYRKLLRALTAMRDHTLFVDDGLLDEILVAIRPAAPVHRIHRIGHRGRRVAYFAGAAAAATAAGAAGALVIASRLSSRTRLAS